MSSNQTCQLIKEASDELVLWAKTTRAEASSPFEAARQLVSRLGAHYRDGRAEIGFWVPELAEQEIPANRIFLEILTPLEPVDFQVEAQQIRFQRQLVNLMPDDEYLWGVIVGMQPGSREQIGSFYWLKYQDRFNEWRIIVDPLAYSVPFGCFAPAEFYDMTRLQAERGDKTYFANLEMILDPDGQPRLKGPTNILQIHVNTASAEGTLAGLTQIYQTIARKRQAGEALTSAEQNYVGYDGIQLMPIEPTIEYEAGPRFWQPLDESPTSETVTVKLRRPSMTNWGYDVMTVASPAPNSTVLGSKRPDELVDFITTLHNFPGKPIKLILDIVYGHADNQTIQLMNKFYFAGSNMYGQNLNYRHPVVRAVLLEMQWRKSNYGVDGIRVDGAQDFKWWDSETNELHHDDDYLGLMNDLEQEVAGQRYRPWMIFEDGRPWPRADWELASSYLEVTKQFPNVVQWGPLTFAHNTPFLFTFWISKWWRIKEIMQRGSHWITGCANHDTLRRGTQVDTAARLNTYLGDTLPEIFKKAYDNPAATMFTYTFSPGIPMDFINALMRAPWSFIRNVDDRYGVKVVSEEARFLDWAIDEVIYKSAQVFPRLKARGFTELQELHRFLHSLNHGVHITDYYLDSMVRLLNNVEPPLAGGPFTIDSLKQIARAWMNDVHDYCNVSHWTAQVEASQTCFNLSVRQFRRQRPWLRENLRANDHFNHQQPTEGTILFYGLRHAPDDQEQLLFIANMEGEPRRLTPAKLPIPNLPADGWQVALRTPGLAVTLVDQPVTLQDSESVVFVRRG